MNAADGKPPKAMHGKANFEKFFRDADEDSDGYLSLDELAEVLTKYGYRCTQEEIQAFFKHADRSGDNRISFDEYMQAMEGGRVTPQLHDEATMRRVFAIFDKDGNGAIDPNELQEVFSEMGKHFTDEEVKRMIERCDLDGSKTLNYEEFIIATKEHKLG